MSASLLRGSLPLHPAREQGKQSRREGGGPVARFWNGIAVVVLAGGLAAASGMPAMAAPATSPTVTVAATSQFRPVTGDVFVLFNYGKLAKAQIHGNISGAASGNVATLFAQPFPFSKAPKPVGSVTLTGPAKPYSFTVTPTLATRYRVELFANSTSTAPLAGSAVKTVYVSNLQLPAGFSKCSRPVCHQNLRVTEYVPASTLRDEIAKRWYFYFGLSLSRTGTPPPPKVLTLDTHATISGATRTSAGSFVRKISWSFRIGNDGFNTHFNLCTKDTEATDGLGLPGHHGCGASRISATVEYLG